MAENISSHGPVHGPVQGPLQGRGLLDTPQWEGPQAPPLKSEKPASDVPFPPPPMAQISRNEVSVYETLNTLLDEHDGELPLASIEKLKSELKGPTFDDFFNSLIFFMSSSSSSNSDSLVMDPLYNTAMTIIHPDSGDASSEKKAQRSSIRQQALELLEEQIQAKEMCLVQRLSALESPAPSASVPSVAPSEIVLSVSVSDDSDNPLDKANTAAPLLNREAIDQINLELLSLNQYRSLWQGYTRALDRVTSLGQGLPSFDEELYVHPTYIHHGLNVGLTRPDGHCFLRALNDPRQDKQIERTQILLGEDYKEGEATTPGSFEWVKNTVREYYRAHEFNELYTLFNLSTDDDPGNYLDWLMKRYFDDKEYASGDIGHFVDTIPTIVFKALATQAPQYIIKLRWDGQSGTSHRQFMLYTFNGDEESCRTFEEASSLMAHLNSLTITPKSSVVFNSGIHYEPVYINSPINL